MIQLRCPKCNAKLLAPEQKAGKRGNCPVCQEQFRVLFSSLAARTAAISEIHDSWFFSLDGKRKDGPVEFARLRDMAHMGRLRKTDMVHQHGAKAWVRAYDVPGVFSEVMDARPIARERSIELLNYDNGEPGSDTDLIACPGCGQMISKRAANCTGCGATNSWLHPRIQAFMRSTDQFRHLPPFQVEAHGYLLVGTAQPQQGPTNPAAEFVGSDGVRMPMSLGGIGTMLLAEMGNSGIQTAVKNGNADSNAQAFYLDLDQRPPLWGSTDDHYWRDVKRFFRLG